MYLPLVNLITINLSIENVLLLLQSAKLYHQLKLIIIWQSQGLGKKENWMFYIFVKDRRIGVGEIILDKTCIPMNLIEVNEEKQIIVLLNQQVKMAKGNRVLLMKYWAE